MRKMTKTINHTITGVTPVAIEKFILRNEKILDTATEYLYSLELDEDEPYELIIKDYTKLRTEEQHCLYRAWIGIISKEAGDSRKALHAFYGDEFLPKVTEKVLGKEIEVVKSTTELGVKDFTLFLKQVEAHAATFFNVTLPHPGDLEW